MEVVAWHIKKDARVVSNRREIDRDSFGNVQFCVHPSGVTNIPFGEKHDVIFYRCAHEFYNDEMYPMNVYTGQIGGDQ